MNGRVAHAWETRTNERARPAGCRSAAHFAGAADAPPRVADDRLIGIVTGGAWLAERLHAALGLKVPFGTLDVSFYRDDFQHKGLKRKVAPSDIPFEVDGLRSHAGR